MIEIRYSLQDLAGTVPAAELGSVIYNNLSIKTA